MFSTASFAVQQRRAGIAKMRLLKRSRALGQCDFPGLESDAASLSNLSGLAIPRRGDAHPFASGLTLTFASPFDSRDHAFWVGWSRRRRLSPRRCANGLRGGNQRASLGLQASERFAIIYRTRALLGRVPFASEEAIKWRSDKRSLKTAS